MGGNVGLLDFRNVVQVTSGLGNQMFQYAFGRAVGAAYDASWFDLSGGSVSVPRRFELPLFQCELPLVDHDEVMNGVRCPRLLRLLGRRPRLETVRESPSGAFEPSYLKRSGVNFVGYFQCERYFLPLREELVRSFRLKDPSREFLARREDLRSRTAVSVHVRRGDYVQQQGTFGLCSVDYYRQAMRYVRTHVKNPVFCFFSDDMLWTRVTFGGEADCVFMDAVWENAACDLLLMAACRHHVIANSTYSWWGAWLDDTPEKIVIAPQRWLAAEDRPDIVPAAWVRL